MTNTADNYGNNIDKIGIAPTFRWGIGTADEFSVGYFYLDNRQRHQLRHALAARERLGRPISETNPGGLIKIDPKNYYGAASDYSAGYASYGTLHYTHRFQDGGALAHGAAQRRLRPRPARLDDPLLRPLDQRAGRGHQSRTARRSPRPRTTVNDATPLTRGTNNKVQDLRATYLQTDYTNKFTWFGRKNELLAGVDLSREEFNNYSMVLPAGVVLNKNVPRTTIGTPNDGTSVDEGLRQKVETRNFVAKALGVYAQDMIEVVPNWKLLAGLRWDRFEGDYVSPPIGTNVREITRSRSDSLWSQRFGVLWQPTETSSYYASYGTSFNTSGELYNYDAQGSNTPPEKSRNIEIGAKLDLFDGRVSARARCSTRPSTTSATAIRPTASRSSTTSSRASAMPPASSSTWPGASRRRGRCSSPTPGSRAPRSTRPARAAP